ncbi:MAG: LLM class flavin-dependent oxidoreductase [Thermomicrobiales bacterium]|nr:LLM class flavin-dependent oxidoreductase [Thermomicrobiales bacterium]
MRPLKIGVQLPEVERVVRWAELREMARTAERIGLDSVWIGDHLLYRAADGTPLAPWEAWSTLAAIAEATEWIEFGPLVAATGFHSPAMLAKKAATIDEISNGRLILGLGAGWNEPDYTAFGFPYDHRASRFEEAFTVIRTLLREGEIDFHGQYYQIRNCALVPRGPRPAGPPLWIGSFGDRVLRATMPHADGWNAWYADYGNNRDGLAALVAKVEGICGEVGRDFSTLELSVAPYVRMPGGTGRSSGDPTMAAIPPIPGDPATLAAELRALAAMGIGHVQLVLDPITVESIAALQPTLELLDQE